MTLPLDEPSGSHALHAMALLADPDRRPVDAGGWLIVVAHPDDETLGIGAQLHRLQGARLILVTDGAPRQGDDARRLGFPDPAAYAEARASELVAALRAGGAGHLPVERLEIPDQEAGSRLGELALRLAELLQGVTVVFTHAYEGGHPDHDAVAYAVHAVSESIPPQTRPAIVEMPFYRAGPDGAFLTQSFEPVPGQPPVQLLLSADDVARKRAMMAAHRSQAEVLAPFEVQAESFREAPRYQFGVPPNAGLLRYPPFPWTGDPGAWQALVADLRAKRTDVP